MTGPHLLLYQNLKKIAIGFLLFFFVILACPGSAFATNTGQFTAELWVKPTSSVASQALLGKSEEIRIFTDASGFVGCQIKATTWQTAATATTNALALNTWAHVACSYNKANIKVYVNGVQVATQSQTSAPDDSANAFLIGQDSSASTPYSNLTGTVDDFKFYNYALNQKQIIADMTGGAGSAQIRSVSAQSPVAYWKFDEGQGTTANNSSNGGSTLNGTLTNMAFPATSTSGWTQSGKFGRALIFDGSNDIVNIGTNVVGPKVNGASAVTISLWANVTAYPAALTRARFYNTAIDLNKTGFALSLYDGGNLEVGGRSATADGFQTTTVAFPGLSAWHHLIGILDYQNSKLYLYIDGILQKTASVTFSSTTYTQGTPTATSTDAIGGYLNNGTTTEPVNAVIDEVKVYPYALTADEIKTDYNYGLALSLGSTGSNSSYAAGAANQEYCIPGDTTSCVAPVGEWRFDENTGATAYDKSGNGLTGTITGASWTSGTKGPALNFSGSSQYVTVADNTLLKPSNITVETWFNTTDKTADQRIISKTQGGNYQLSLWNNADANCTTANLCFLIYANSAYHAAKYALSNLSNNTWYHAVGTFDGRYTRLYVNGQLVNTDDAGATYSMGTATSPVCIGSEPNASDCTDGVNFKGKIDQVRIFNYARSAAQVAYDYNRGGPVGWWKMDECQGTAIHDASGQGNNGALTIGASGEDTVGTCTTSSTAWGSGASGKYGASISFDGTDDKVIVATAINNVQSVSFWVKPSTNTDSFMDLDGGTHYITSSSGTVSATGFSSPTIYVNGISGGTVTGGAWNNIVVSTATSFNTTSSMTLGYKSAVTADYLNGQLDDVRVFNYALTAAQVKNVYNEGYAIRFGP